jgi:hypothetical protein
MHAAFLLANLCATSRHDNRDIIPGIFSEAGKRSFYAAFVASESERSMQLPAEWDFLLTSYLPFLTHRFTPRTCREM